MRILMPGRDYSLCKCGATISAHAKQCRDCYRKNKGHHADLYSRPKASTQPDKEQS